MNRRVLPLFLLLLGWFALGFWLCKKYLCNGTPSQSISQSSLAPSSSATAAWLIADEDNFNATSPDYFGFAKSGATHLGLSAGLETVVANTAAYLKSHPNRVLDITGYYMDDEKNNSIMPTLGIGRANDIKGLFVAAGVPSNQLNLKDALLTDANWADADNVNRGIELGFSSMPTAEADTRLEDIRARLVGKPITVYFETNKDKLNLNSQQRKDFADIIYYLDRVSESSLGINGHTDKPGRRSTNVKLSKDRAESVKKYLVSNGLNASRMQTKGFGPDQPIASNDNEDGMAKNRRVEIVLK